SGTISSGAVTGGGNALEVITSDTATFASIAGLGEFDVASMLVGGEVVVSRSLAAASVATAAVDYAITFQGTGAVTGSAIFSNTGNLSIGASFAFASGATINGPPLLVTGDAVISTGAGQ